MSNDKNEKKNTGTSRPADAPLYQKLTVPKKKAAEPVRHRAVRHSAVAMGKEMDQPIGRLSVMEEKKPAEEKTVRRTRQKAAAAADSIKSSAKKETAPRTASRGRTTRRKKEEEPKVRLYFLGGLNEIGKNFTLVECGSDMFIIDCGMAFPSDELLGVDLVIPDFTFVEQNRDRIRGIVLTHGHEDHIGSLPYLLKKVNLPVYGTALTLGLVEGKLEEHGLKNQVHMEVRSPGDHVVFGCMDVEFIHVNHSISDAVAFAIHTPAGVIVHTGDFKIDFTPVQGGMIDLGRFAELGKQGVLALLADSTNAERPGYTKTEQSVFQTFEHFFSVAENARLIIATFASNISRVQQIINCAVRHGRKVAFSGRSMLNVMGIAARLGYLEIPDGVLIDIDMINRYPREQVVLVTTGSQGEPMSALSRMAFADHRKVEVGPGDTIIISARPIPGNEKTVGTVVDELLKRGCRVVYESMYEVHVSGHACQEELKIMQAIVRPQYFIPVHGEQKHLRKHADLARQMGLPDDHIFIGDVGSAVELSKSGMKQLSAVPAGCVMVDGLGVGDVGSVVLRDRRHLGEDGLIVVVCTIDRGSGQVVSGPDVVSRGFVYVRESEELMEEIRRLVDSILENSRGDYRDWGMLKTRIRDGLSRLLFERTRRSPMILPIIMEV